MGQTVSVECSSGTQLGLARGSFTLGQPRIDEGVSLRLALTSHTTRNASFKAVYSVSTPPIRTECRSSSSSSSLLHSAHCTPASTSRSIAGQVGSIAPGRRIYSGRVGDGELRSRFPGFFINSARPGLVVNNRRCIIRHRGTMGLGNCPRGHRSLCHLTLFHLANTPASKWRDFQANRLLLLCPVFRC